MTHAAVEIDNVTKTFDDLDMLSDMIDDEYLEELERRQEERVRLREQGGGTGSGVMADGA